MRLAGRPPARPSDQLARWARFLCVRHKVLRTDQAALRVTPSKQRLNSEIARVARWMVGW